MKFADKRRNFFCSINSLLKRLYFIVSGLGEGGEVFYLTTLSVTKNIYITVELGYNVLKGTEYFVSL